MIYITLALINYCKIHSFHFLKIIFSPPKWIFGAAKKYAQTNPLLFSELNFSYNSESQMTSFELTNFGTSPVGATVNSLIAGNLPNLKKLSNILKFRLNFVHFLNKYLEINSTLFCLVFFG